MSITRRLAECIAGSSYADIPADTVVLAKECVLDHVANLLVGSREELGRIIIEYVKDLGGAPVCAVAGSGLRTSPVQAAYAHGTFARALDFDNTWFNLGHPVASTLPPALALGIAGARLPRLVRWRRVSTTAARLLARRRAGHRRSAAQARVAMTVAAASIG